MTAAPRLLVCTRVGGARRVDAAGAAVAVAREVASPEGTLVLDLRAAAAPPRGTLLASAEARGLERTCREAGALRAAARGRILLAAPLEDCPVEEAVAHALEPMLGAALVVALCDGADFRPLLAAAPGRRSALIRAEPGEDRALLALAAGELIEEAIPVKVWNRPIGLVPARRAFAGLEPGGQTGVRAARFARVLCPARRGRREPFAPGAPAEQGQALPAVLGIALLVVAVALILVALGGAATAKGRMQRAADLAALSAARSMRDDFDRLFEPPRLADGAVNPAHLERSEYLERARSAALVAAERNGVEAESVRVRFPDGTSFAPLRVRVEATGEIEIDGEAVRGEVTRVRAEAEASPPARPLGASPDGRRRGERGRLRRSAGVPAGRGRCARMSPPHTTAWRPRRRRTGSRWWSTPGSAPTRNRRALFEQNPDPRMVAPPGTSLHRCATELDLGPPAAYGWLAANAERYGFLQRYSWEAWHYGYVDGPEPCSAEAEADGLVGSRGRDGEADGEAAGTGGLPAFVPPQYREMLLSAAARHDVSAALLAAQIMAESNFNPNAVSPAGAQGIAQFMPATAAAYGLDDPFDPERAIDAQARMMSELLAQFGSVELALAAYNAGPGAVAGCDCIPPYPETQAYVARIMGLLDGARRAPGGRRRARARGEAGRIGSAPMALPVEIDGLDGAQALIGETIGPTEWREITQEDIDLFAKLSGDDQWIHVDVERAKAESPFGTTIAHGNLTLSTVDGFRLELLSVTGVKLGVNYGWNKVRFPAPVPAGAPIRASAELVSIDELDGGWFQQVTRFTIEVEGNEKPCCVGDSRRPRTRLRRYVMTRPRARQIIESRRSGLRPLSRSITLELTAPGSVIRP